MKTESTSWILTSLNPFRYKSIEPILMKDKDILKLDVDVYLYNTRKEDLIELVEEMSKLTYKNVMKEFSEEKPLHRSDPNATVWKCIQSLFARWTAPTIFFIFVPLFRIQIERFIKQSYDKNPEWWI